MRNLLLAVTIATFSIVARDPQNGELGVAVASRFFAVGSVVPYLEADAGAVATQANANVTYGPQALALLERGATADEALRVLLRNDPTPGGRQVGIVGKDGTSVSFTGPDCVAWAGGRSGPNYAVQGNILAGEAVVRAMETTFLSSTGTLAQRLNAALAAGDAAGGDARGRQSAALIIVKEGAGYNRGNDRAIDIRVDDHPEPFRELARLLALAESNRAWTEGFVLFSQNRLPEALVAYERAVRLAPENPELLYDLAVIRFANGRRDEALQTLEKAVRLNPRLKVQAANDRNFATLRQDEAFRRIIR